MSTERLTKQKTIILEYLQSVKTHPTADEIFLNVKKRLPSISRSTVYRNLENFSRQGIILEIPGDKKHFDGDIREHHHFVCEKCKKVYDLFFELNLTDKNYKEIKKHGQLKNSQIIFSGICKKCLSS